MCMGILHLILCPLSLDILWVDQQLVQWAIATAAVLKLQLPNTAAKNAAGGGSLGIWLSQANVLLWATWSTMSCVSAPSLKQRGQTSLAGHIPALLACLNLACLGPDSPFRSKLTAA